MFPGLKKQSVLVAASSLPFDGPGFGQRSLEPVPELVVLVLDSVVAFGFEPVGLLVEVGWAVGMEQASAVVALGLIVAVGMTVAVVELVVELVAGPVVEPVAEPAAEPAAGLVAGPAVAAEPAAVAVVAAVVAAVVVAVAVAEA